MDLDSVLTVCFGRRGGKESSIFQFEVVCDNPAHLNQSVESECFVPICSGYLSLSGSNWCGAMRYVEREMAQALHQLGLACRRDIVL